MSFTAKYVFFPSRKASIWVRFHQSAFMSIYGRRSRLYRYPSDTREAFP